MNNFIGTKVQQTQGFLENGNRTPITVVKASDLFVVGLKTLEKEGYNAVKIGFGTAKKPTKAIMGIAKKASMELAPSKMVEERLTAAPTQALGDIVKVEEVLSIGDLVDVTGVSKGKGFAGGVKRYGFAGGPKTHGQSDRHRAPGSIGSGTTPGRVYKGKRMAGNMGKEQVTVKNLVVIDINVAEKIVMIGGLVPGIMGGTVSIKKVGEVKEKNFSPLFKIVADVPVEEVAPEAVIEDVAASEVPVVAEEVVAVEVAPETVEPVVESSDEAKEVDGAASDVAEVGVANDESKEEAK